MEFSKNDSKLLKGVAIIFMLLIHLFCRKEVNGLYNTFPTINGVPFIYYLALFGDACLPIFCFLSGYGLFTISQGTKLTLRGNVIRIFRLLINYWVILVLFIIIGHFAGKSDFPGSLVTFILNFFALSSSYNGAWWFLQTYIILLVVSPFLVKSVNRANSTGILSISFAIYFACYLQRIKHIVDLGDTPIVNAIVGSLVLVGTSQFPFIVGAVFSKGRFFSAIFRRLSEYPYKNLLCILGILALVIIHSIFETMFIAPFTAISFICLFSVMEKSRAVEKGLKFLGNYSTNIWLTHMFFYKSIFPEVTFAPKYPVLILAWLMILCLVSSFVINCIYKPIIQLFDKVVRDTQNSRVFRFGGPHL